MLFKWDGIAMNKCIYSEKDDSTATFNTAEHIIPKCIGGIRCLPRGWVSDEVNNQLSALELSFSRENPIVTIYKMFGSDTGRKKHRNRYKVGVFTNRGKSNEISLGYMKNAIPFPLNQIVFSNLTEVTIDNQIEVKVILSPSLEFTHEELIEAFWNSIKQYNGCPSCIKDKEIPQNTYLLGIQDHRWFLGVSKDENPETVKPLVLRAIQKLITRDFNEIIRGNSNIQSSSTQVTAHFTICFNYKDCFRVYAKIALNCLAFLKGQDYALLPEFNNIREAVLTGKDILNYACISEGENMVKPIFSRFSGRISFGDKCHSVIFISKDCCLYGLIALYGLNNPIMVKLSEQNKRFDTDIYICDWQNQKDYKLIDCVLKICEPDVEDEFEE